MSLTSYIELLFTVLLSHSQHVVCPNMSLNSYIELLFTVLLSHSKHVSILCVQISHIYHYPYLLINLSPDAM